MVRKIRPLRKTIFIGMLCQMEHVRENQELAKLKESEGLDVQLGIDGQHLEMKLY